MTPVWNDVPVVVLDACSLIAYFNDEPGAEIVASILQDVPFVEIPAINVLEIAYDSVRRTGENSAARAILEAVRQLPISIRWEMDDEILESASRFKARFKISIADAIALSVAHSRNAPLVSSDHHEFDALETAGQSRFIRIR
jgi:predicted nucleic acid-binding protein